MKSYLCKAFAVLTVVLLLVSQASAYDLNWTAGASTDDYSTGNNWFNPAPYGVSFPPDPGSSIYIFDQTVSSPTVVMYSGSSTVLDFSVQTNTPGGLGGDASFTIKSGASLHSTNNFDVGYYNGADNATVTIENGATVDVDGYFGGGRPGPHTIYLYGLVNAGVASIGGADFIEFGSTGVMNVTGDVTSDLNTVWIPNGLFTADAGYQVVGSYDSNNNLTTISTVPVPEPVSGSLVLMGLGGLLLKRGSRGKAAR